MIKYEFYEYEIVDETVIEEYQETITEPYEDILRETVIEEWINDDGEKQLKSVTKTTIKELTREVVQNLTREVTRPAYKAKKIYQFPSNHPGGIVEMLTQFPSILEVKHIIETDEYGEICNAVIQFDAEKARNNIDPELSDDEALKELERIRNTPPEEPLPSAEEQIAALQVYETLTSLSNEDGSAETNVLEEIAAALSFLAINSLQEKEKERKKL